jgi:HD superfamily phosphohydrolase
VSYGKYNLDWLIDNLHLCPEGKDVYLGLSERAISTFDDFLLSRFHMFMMVYFHYRAVCLEQMLLRYFQTAKNEYAIPSDIEKYQEHDDPYLLKVLRKSQNPWAKRIIRNDIPQKVLETFGERNLDVMAELEQFFKTENIASIKCSSTGRLSKYYENTATPSFPIKVKRTSGILTQRQESTYRNVNEATDLFDKYSKSHAVNRLHCDYTELSVSQQRKVQEILAQQD